MEKNGNVEIGFNAGRVWHALYERNDGMTLAELTQNLSLSDFDVAAALGWLAREGKIYFSERTDGAIAFSVFIEYYY